MEKTVPSLSPKSQGMGISFMPQGGYFKCTCDHLHKISYSSTSPTAPLLSSHSSLFLTSHYPLWFHLSWSSTLCSLLKMLFSQSSPVSHPSSYFYLPFLYPLIPSSHLPLYYWTVWPRWCCLRAHNILLSPKTWNLKRGAFNLPLPT